MLCWLDVRSVRQADTLLSGDTARSLFRHTGNIATDWHGASVYFLFDPYKKTWSREARQRLGIPMEMLPEAYPCTQVIGEVTPEAG